MQDTVQVWPFTLPKQSLTLTPQSVGKPPEHATSSVMVLVMVVTVVVCTQLGGVPLKTSCEVQV